MGLLFDPEGLHESFERQDGTKAAGVDGMSKKQYGTGLDERLAELSGRLSTVGLPAQAVTEDLHPERGWTFSSARNTEL